MHERAQGGLHELTITASTLPADRRSRLIQFIGSINIFRYFSLILNIVHHTSNE